MTTTGTKDILTPVHQAPSPLVGGLIWANAAAWAALIPTVIAVELVAQQLPGPNAQEALYLSTFALAALVNLAGSLALARANRLLGGPGGATARGAVIQAATMVACCGALGYATFLAAYRQITGDTHDTVRLVTAIVAMTAYTTGQVVLGQSLRPLSRRIAFLYAAAPALFACYAVALGASGYNEWQGEFGSPVPDAVIILAGLIAMVFFVLLPVLWFRLAVLVHRRSRA